MIDYTLSFPDAATREVYYPTPEGSPPSWYVGNRAVMPVRVVRADALYDEADPDDPVLVTPEDVAPGAWLVIRCQEPDAMLAAHPALVIVTDSERAAVGDPFILFKAASVTWEALQARIEPVWAGDSYPFGAGVGEDDLVAD